MPTLKAHVQGHRQLRLIQVFGVDSSTGVCHIEHGGFTQQKLRCRKLEHSCTATQILFPHLYLSSFPQSDLTQKPLCHHPLPSCCRHGNVNLISPPIRCGLFLERLKSPSTQKKLSLSVSANTSFMCYQRYRYLPWSSTFPQNLTQV